MSTSTVVSWPGAFTYAGNSRAWLKIMPEPIVVAIKVDDPALSDRLTALLSDVPGLRLARVNEGGDVALVPSHTGEKTVEQDAALTPRCRDCALHARRQHGNA